MTDKMRKKNPENHIVGFLMNLFANYAGNCYRPPSAPSCALDTISELIALHLSSELVLLGDLNWDMLNFLRLQTCIRECNHSLKLITITHCFLFMKIGK